ncbi:MAG: BamA/TamA family outer membrane protein [Chitinophagaceae bacterium]
MIRQVYLIIFLCVIGLCLKAQPDSILHRVWLIGDAGKLKNGTNPQLEFLKKLNLVDNKSTVLFLGDNIYPVGLPDSQSRQYAKKKQVLDQQVSVVKNTAAKAFFIPGNHDWLQGRSKGWQQLQHQYGYITSLQLPNVQFLPENGCPGPVEIALNDKSVLVIVDTQWWLQQNERPGENSDCDCKNEDEVVSRLKEIVYRNRGKLLFFAAHHPFKTNGPHGGYFTAKQHLFPLTDLNDKLYIPLPVLGSLYPLLRGTFGNIQDVKHPLYKSMIQKLDEVLSQHPYCIRVSGHEHSLQYILQNNQQYIVSGAASKSSPVHAGKGTLFVQKGEGFGLIELYTDGRIQLKFYSLTNKQQPIYEIALRAFQEKLISDEVDVISSFPDSVTAIAAPGFKAGKFKRFLWGDNYRNEWATPIRVPVFNIAKEKGGLKALLQGGRLQSKSLRLEDSSGHQYVLRSIEKYPERILPEEFRQTFIKNALVDAISASYPYAAVSVPILATAAGVPHANPKIVFMPDDPRLGIYQTDFANKLYIFEEREPGGLKKTYSTPKVLEELQKDNDNTIDEQATLQARLLDMFMMDFDRHEDQWRWGKNEKKKGDSYYPIPRDRDQPFFINQGVIPGIISKPWLQPRFQGFRKKAKNINTYNFNGRFFDRLFLTGLSKQDWEKLTDAFIPLMTDSVIESALKKQPAAIQSYSLPFIIETLKERRNYFKGDVMKYYKFLAKEVDIYGTDKKDWFAIDRLMDGSVHIQLYKLNKDGEKSTKTFDRIFYSSDTKEIRLWGRGGEDHFDMRGDASKTIRVRIVGGPGNDIINIGSQHSGAGKTILYDLTTEQNSITGNGKWKNKLADDPVVNEISPRAYKYNILMPMLAATYNPDDGLFLGLTIKNTSHGFRKQPYKAVHQWKATYALATGAYNFSYHFDAVDIIGKTDLVIQADLKAPNNTSNFFGVGNETIFDKSAGKKINFYRTRYNTINAAALFKINPATGISLLAGPVFNYFDIDSTENKNRIINAASIPGIDPLSLFKSKSFAGARLQINIDLRNNKTITTRGMYWQSYFQALKGLSGSSTNLTQFSTDLSFYTSFNKAANLVLAGRIGGGINFGKYQFFQAQYLGGNDNLRGFRKFRFAGDRMLYSNIDVRLHLFDFRGYIIPGSLGVLGFNDIGRVWIRGEKSTAWHHGYGAGIWVAPAKRYIITACYAYSKDGGLPFISLGFQF